MNNFDFESASLDVFHFLVSDFGFQPAPITRERYGGHTRVFDKNNLKVRISVGDLDSNPWCGITITPPWFNLVSFRKGSGPSFNARVRSQAPEFRFKNWQEITSEQDALEHLTEIAQVLREEASDLLEGDFSSWPTYVFPLLHIDRVREVTRLLGVFSDLEKAQFAITERKDKRGYSDHPDGFEVWAFELDDRGIWLAGIPLDR